MDENTLDLIEAAHFLKISEETMRRLADAGEVPAARIGHAWVFAKSDLVDYLRRQIREQTEQRRAAKEAKTVVQPLKEVAPRPLARKKTARRELPVLPELGGQVAAA